MAAFPSRPGTRKDRALRTMRLLRLGLGLGLVLVAAPTALRAYGPETHAFVAALARPRLATRPDTAFLGERAPAHAFVRAARSPDLAFDPARGGKSDPELNAILHDRAFLFRVVAMARRRGDPVELAAALGMVAHLAGDEIGNTAEAALSRNTLGWPTDRDLAGRPVGDPSRGTSADLHVATTAINKLVYDAALRRHRPAGVRRAPFVPRALLDAALRASLPTGTPTGGIPPPGPAGEPESSWADPETRVKRFRASARRFELLGHRLLSGLERRLESKAELFPGFLAAIGTGPGASADEHPELATAAAAIEAAVRSALEAADRTDGGDPPRADPGEPEPPRGLAAACLDPSLSTAFEAFPGDDESEEAQRGDSEDEDEDDPLTSASALPQADLEPVPPEAIPSPSAGSQPGDEPPPAPPAGPGDPADPSNPGATTRKVLIRFALEAARPRRLVFEGLRPVLRGPDWEEFAARIRGAADLPPPSPSATPEPAWAGMEAR